MVTLATIVITLTPLIADHVVIWTFDSEACRMCQERQVALMRAWARPGDTIEIIGQGDSRSWVREQMDSVSSAPIVHMKERGSADRATGFTLRDNLSGERFSYRASGGRYDPGRATYILELLRDPD